MDDLNRAAEHFLKALDDIDVGKFLAAEEKLLEALKFAPTRPSILINLSIVYGRLKDNKKANYFANRAVSSNPKDIPSRLQLAYNLIEMRDYSSALNHATEAITLNPLSYEAHALLGRIFSETGRFETSIEHYQKAIQIDNCRASAYEGLGFNYFRQSKYLEAKESFEIALQMDNSDLDVISGLALLPIGFINEDEYQELYSRIDTLIDKIDPIAQEFLKARLLSHMSRLEEAFEYFKKANANRRSDFKEHEVSRWKQSIQYAQERILSWRSDGSKYSPKIEDKILFIIGPSRSGKSTIEQFLHQSSLVEIGFEGGLATVVIDNVNKLAGFRIVNDLESYSASLARIRFELFASRSMLDGLNNSEYITITNPNLASVAHLLFDLVPNSKFIFIERDVIDNAAEIFIKDYKDRSIFAYDPDLIELYINNYQDMSQNLMSKMGSRAIGVNYHDICTNPLVVLEKVSRFLELPKMENFNFVKAPVRAPESRYRNFYAALSRSVLS